MPDIVEDLQPNLLENMIRQRKLMSSFTGGLPQSPMPQQPDVTVHVHHALGLPDAQPTVPDESMQTGVAPGPSQVAPQEAPTPKIGPIDPNSANPAESAYKQSLMNEPMHGDYHPSKLRNILSTVAGMATGAFQGPEAGASLRQGLRDAPFIGQHQDWAQYSGNKEKLANEEIAGNATAGKQALTQAQIAEQEALAKLHQHEALTYHPVTQGQQQEDNQSHLKVDTREAKMLDGTIKHLVQRNGLFYDPETNAKVDRAAIEDISDEGKSLKETKASRIPGNLGASVQAKKIIAAGVNGTTEDGIKVDQPTFDAAKEFDAKLQKGEEPNGAFARIITDRNKERVAAGQKPLTSQEEEALQVKLLSVEKPGGVLMVNPADNTVGKYGPGTVLPKGAQSPQQLGTTEAKAQKELDDLKDDKDFVNDYLNNQTHTGPGDEALLERFFNATKPSTGFRMNQAQIKLLTDLRSIKSKIKAGIAHLSGGTLFDDKQRKEIVDQINAITAIKVKNHGGQSSTPAPTVTHRYNPSTGQIEAVQ